MNPTLPTVLALTLLSTAAHSQSLPDGYTQTVTPLTAAPSHLLEVASGLVMFDGTTLQLEPNGQPAQTLLQFSPPVFGAFLRELDNGEILFAESSTGEVWRVPLDGSAASLLTTINLPYDAAQIGPQHVVLSAKTGGFAAVDNDLLALDLATGQTTPLGSIAGASGALCRGPAGDLLYATAPANFPPPPQSVDILSFSASQLHDALQQTTSLQQSNATTLCSGIDAVGYMVLDHDEDLLFSDWLNNSIEEIDDLWSTASRRRLVDYAGTSWYPAWLQYVAAQPHDVFEPFATGGTLLILETDYVVSRSNRITPRPVRLLGPATPVATGPFAVDVTDGPTQGVAFLALGWAVSGVPTQLTLPGIEQALTWDTGLLHPQVTLILPLDAAGGASYALNNPGVLPGLTFHMQCAVLSAGSNVLGGTSPLAVTLAP